MPTTHPTAGPPEPHPPPPSRQDLPLPVLTRAGARVDRIPPTVAWTFLARLGDAAWTHDIDLALGALTDSGELAGVAVLSPPAPEWTSAYVAVTPARRRLGLGADLLVVLLDAAGNRGLHGLACALETDTGPARLLCGSLGLTPKIVRSPHGPDVAAIPVPLSPSRQPRGAHTTPGRSTRGPTVQQISPRSLLVLRASS